MRGCWRPAHIVHRVHSCHGRDGSHQVLVQHPDLKIGAHKGDGWEGSAPERERDRGEGGFPPRCVHIFAEAGLGRACGVSGWWVVVGRRERAAMPKSVGEHSSAIGNGMGLGVPRHGLTIGESSTMSTWNPSTGGVPMLSGMVDRFAMSSWTSSLRKTRTRCCAPASRSFSLSKASASPALSWSSVYLRGRERMFEGGRGRPSRQPRAQPAPNARRAHSAVAPAQSSHRAPAELAPHHEALPSPAYATARGGYSTIARAPSSLPSRTIPSGHAPPWRCQHQG